MSVYSAYNIGRLVGRVQEGKVDPTLLFLALSRHEGRPPNAAFGSNMDISRARSDVLLCSNEDICRCISISSRAGANTCCSFSPPSDLPVGLVLPNPVQPRLQKYFASALLDASPKSEIFSLPSRTR
jgi:hypothetical protein